MEPIQDSFSSFPFIKEDVRHRTVGLSATLPGDDNLAWDPRSS